MKTIKYILVFLFILVGHTENNFSGLWQIKYYNEHFFTEVYFQAEMGHWIFDYSSYLKNLDGSSSKRMMTSEYMSGTYYNTKGYDNIILCITEKFIFNGKDKNFIDENKKPYEFAFRLTSDTTATFGRLMGLDIYESYSFIKKRE